MLGTEHQHTGDGPFCSTCGQPKDDVARKPKPKATVLQTIAGCGILLVLAMVLVGGVLWAISALMDTEPTPAATAAPTVQPTETCPTEAEQEYFDQVASVGVSAFTLVTMFGEELQAASETPWVVSDEFWMFARETDVMGMDGAFERLIALEAPASAEHIDNQVEEAARLMQEALQIMNIGIQDIDMEILELGGIQMERVTPKILALTDITLAFCE